MKQQVNIELIIAYIEGSLNSVEKVDEVQTLIESNKDWFSAYVDLKSNAEELKNAKFEVTPDQLLNPQEKKAVKSTPKFDLNWLLKPQIGLGVACMLIVVVFVSLNREVDDFELLTDPNIKNLQMTSETSDIVKLNLNESTLKIFNSSTDQLTVSVNDSDYTLGIFDSLEISLEIGDNHIIILNSNLETIQDTVITN
tara:strand:+ start:2872 stop:3462 length:591 start_codon:yes stop_codon:yes gene_type:complete